MIVINYDFDLEYLTDFTIFERSYMIRRTAQLFNRKIEDTSNMTFPKNVMLHLLDNVAHSESSSDVFDVKQYPFLVIKNNLKYLMHSSNLEFDRKLVDLFPHRIYRPKLLENLRNFSRDHRKIMIPALNFENLADNRNTILIKNYNPLYRLISTSNKNINEYYRYKAIMSNILNDIISMRRTNFIVIPVPKDVTVDRTNLLTIAASGVSNQRLLSNSHFYFMMIDLVTLLLDHETEVSTLKLLPLRDLQTINFLFCNQGQGVTFNLGTLMALVDNKARAIGFINNILNLNRAADVAITLDDTESEPDKSNASTDNDPQVNNEAVVQVKSHDKVTEIVKVEVTSSIKSRIIQDKIEEDYDDDDIPEIEEIPELPELDDDSSSTDIDNTEKPSSTYKSPDVVKDIRANTGDLTPKQKERIVKLSEQYKSIKISDSTGKAITIGDILDKPVNIKLTTKTISQLKDSSVDQSSISSRTRAFDHGYRTQLLDRDILNTVVSFKDNGLFLTDYKEELEANSFTRLKHVKATFEDIRHKKHTLNFKLPYPDSNGHYLINGIKLFLSKQLVNVPICKISPTRVSLVSNYNKTLVQKVGSSKSSYMNQLKSIMSDNDISVISHTNTYIGLDLPYDYKLIGSTTSVISNNEFEFDFTYTHRDAIFTEAMSFEDRFGTVVAKGKTRNHYLFINKDGICSLVDIKLNSVISTGFIFEYISDKLQVPHDWCELKILDKNLPVIFILGFKYGVSTVLNKLKIKYTKYNLNEKVTLGINDLSIRFKDCKIVFSRYPLLHSNILSGLSVFNTKKYNMIEFDDADTYYQLLMDRNMSINYLKGISAYFNFFIDPITKNVLEEMKEPTNTRDLLIRAVEMLTEDKDREPSSIANFRVRSDERLPAIIYNEISRQYANYINSNFRDATFSINTEAIFQRILQDQTMILKEDINPIHAIKEFNRITYAGFGGRTSESFVERDRKYPNDALGILSETTTDSGSVGMVSALSADPNISSLRGLFNTEDPDKKSANIFNDTSLLMPGILHDDQPPVQLISNDQYEFSLIAGTYLEPIILQRNQK